MSKGSRQLPLEWRVPDDMSCQYATNLLVQHTDHEFVIQFFRAMPPLVVGSPDEVKTQLAEIESVNAECVARVVVAASRMPEFVDVLQQNLQRFQDREQD